MATLKNKKILKGVAAGIAGLFVLAATASLTALGVLHFTQNNDYTKDEVDAVKQAATVDAVNLFNDSSNMREIIINMNSTDDISTNENIKKIIDANCDEAFIAEYTNSVVAEDFVRADYANGFTNAVKELKNQSIISIGSLDDYKNYALDEVTVAGEGVTATYTDMAKYLEDMFEGQELEKTEVKAILDDVLDENKCKKDISIKYSEEKEAYTDSVNCVVEYENDLYTNLTKDCGLNLKPDQTTTPVDPKPIEEKYNLSIKDFSEEELNKLAYYTALNGGENSAENILMWYVNNGKQGADSLGNPDIFETAKKTESITVDGKTYEVTVEADLMTRFNELVNAKKAELNKPVVEEKYNLSKKDFSDAELNKLAYYTALNGGENSAENILMWYVNNGKQGVSFIEKSFNGKQGNFEKALKTNSITVDGKTYLYENITFEDGLINHFNNLINTQKEGLKSQEQPTNPDDQKPVDPEKPPVEVVLPGEDLGSKTLEISGGFNKKTVDLATILNKVTGTTVDKINYVTSSESGDIKGYSHRYYATIYVSDQNGTMYEIKGSFLSNDLLQGQQAARVYIAGIENANRDSLGIHFESKTVTEISQELER